MKIFYLMITLFCLAGCFASTPNSRFYLFETDPRISEVSNKKINIAVQDIFVPEYLDRAQIVLQKPSSAEISIAEFDRWGADLNSSLQNAMINNLQKALPQSVIKPLLYGSATRFVVKVNIERLGGWLNDLAYLSGNWQILNSKGRILIEEDFTKMHNAGKDYNAYVMAQSMMWGEISQDIAQKIIRLK